MTKSFVTKEEKRCNIFLYFSALTANLTAFSLGSAAAWSSPAIPRLNGQIDSENNPLQYKITPYEESWIASFLPLGSAISVFISGYFSSRIGRKRTLLASTLPTIAGFIALTCGDEVFHFYIGRFLCGLGAGAVFTIIPIYVAEISERTNRGTLGCFMTFFMSLGCLYVYIPTPYVSLRILSASNLIAPLIFLILFAFFVPESPYYYVSKNRIHHAENSLLKLRYNDEEIVGKELPIIVKNVRESFEEKVTVKEIINDPLLRKAFGISLGLIGFQQWSGINAVFFYMQSIFDETGSGISSETCVIIAGLVQLLASACTLPTVDRFGRKILLLTSGIGNALTLFVSGGYFYLRERTSIDVTRYNLLPVITINMFILTYTLGFGPISFAMIGELFPPHVKSLAASVNIFVCFLSIFSVTNLFPIVRESIGLGLSFGLLGAICCVSVAFVYVKVPETKGKRLEEIQDILRINR